MNDQNPYQPSETQSALVHPGGIKQVDIRTFDLLRRGREFLGPHYFPMVGACFVAYFVGSLVPFGLILGAMVVGIVYALMQIEQFGRFDFGVIFKGFDKFMEGLIVILCTIAFGFLMMIPVMIIFGIGFFGLALTAEQGDAMPIGMIIVMLFFYIAIILCSFLVYVPFIFSFYLVGDRQCDGLEAVKQSWHAVKSNLMGVIKFHLVCGIITMLGAMACYIGAILFLPISFAAYFVLYRDIFGPGTTAAPPLEGAPPYVPPQQSSMPQ